MKSGGEWCAEESVAERVCVRPERGVWMHCGVSLVSASAKGKVEGQDVLLSTEENSTISVWKSSTSHSGESAARSTLRNESVLHFVSIKFEEIAIAMKGP